jgi:hypothetical protein
MVLSTANTTAQQNTAVGYNSLRTTTTGGFNTVMGYLSGESITTGSGNAFLD